MMQSCEPDFDDKTPVLSREEWDEELRVGGDFGDIARMERALANGADINGSDRNERSPLHRACIGIQLEAARFLINRGAYIDAVNGVGNTPLAFACRMGEEKLARMLLCYGADVHGRSRESLNPYNSPLYIACADGRVDIVKLLIEAGADPFQGEGFQMPVVQPFANSRIEAARYLIDAGVVHRHKGFSLLQACVGASRPDEVGAAKLLLDQVPELITQEDLDVSLALACQYSDLDLPRLLIERGANVDYYYSFSERTPLTAAAIRGNAEVVALLLDNGADVTKSGEAGVPAIDGLLRVQAKNERHAQSALLIMRKMGLSPLDKVNGKTLLSRFSNESARTVIKEAQRTYRAELLAESIGEAMGDVSDQPSQKKSSVGLSL
jgi:ankyrin repeat protein